MTWGPTGNSAVETVLAVEPASPTPLWDWAAAYTSAAIPMVPKIAAGLVFALLLYHLAEEPGRRWLRSFSTSKAVGRAAAE